MKNTTIPDLLYYPVLILIILASFMLFSPVYFPFIDTGTAISIIMTPGVNFPGDLYPWGQNFSGTFVPYVSNLLHIIYRFPPDLAVSVVTWMILVCGFLSVSTLMRSRFSMLLLAVVWFFPSWLFIGHLTTVFGLQTSFMGITIYLVNRYYKAYTLNAKLMWLALFCLSLIIAVWVSDLAVVSIVLLITLLLLDKKDWFRSGKTRERFRNRPDYLKAAVIILSAVGGILFIGYAKWHAQNLITYTHPLLNDPVSFFQNIGLIFMNLVSTLIFKTGNITGSIYAWALLIGIPLVLALSRPGMRLLSYIRSQKWAWFFLLNAILLMISLVLSGWVFSNGAQGKYFSVVFMPVWIVILMITGSTGTNHPVLRRSVLACMMFLGVISSLAPLWFPKPAKANAVAYEELKRLNAFGIIGESSLVYAIASTDPNHIKPLPHDKELMRNYELRKEVFRQHTILFLKDGWLESFPDTISQYGVVFQKTGAPMRKSGLELCRYEQYAKRTIFPVDSMKHQGALLPDTTAFSGKAAMITIPFDRSMHFIYGPFISLPKGKYTAVYRIKVSRDLGINKFAVLNISYNWGKNVLVSRTLRLCEFARSNHFEEFDLPFETLTDLQGVEFRIMYLGESDLYFDRVVLIEKQ